MARSGGSLAVDRMSDAQLWAGVERHISRARSRLANMQPRLEIDAEMRHALACALELKTRGQQLTLIPDGSQSQHEGSRRSSRDTVLVDWRGTY
jgi:hypothetical protein